MTLKPTILVIDDAEDFIEALKEEIALLGNAQNAKMSNASA